MRKHRAKALLMGGQACVFYGAAEFSRDTDFAILAVPANLVRLGRVLKELDAEVIAVPPFQLKYLRRGHAVHFRCRHPEALNLRLDVMSKMRGVPPFENLWQRRTTLELDGQTCDLMSLPDLVQAKKTQRDKDWPMLRRLLETHYFEHREAASNAQIKFWFKELRTPILLIELANDHPALCRKLLPHRPLLANALSKDEVMLQAGLLVEERQERLKDSLYWAPLRKELETLRHERLRIQF